MLFFYHSEKGYRNNAYVHSLSYSIRGDYHMLTERSKRAIFSQRVVLKLRVWKIKGGYRETSGEEGDPRRHIGTQRDVKAGSSGSR